MSKEYGCTSDPENMLDAQVVKLDGSVVWASAEPDLLWGLRGAYIGVGGKSINQRQCSNPMLICLRGSRHEVQTAGTQVSPEHLGRAHHHT